MKHKQEDGKLRRKIIDGKESETGEKGRRKGKEGYAEMWK